MPTAQPSEQLQPHCYEHHVEVRIVEAFVESIGPKTRASGVRLSATTLRCPLRSLNWILHRP
jgi:hypothetical protein